jgi:dipeptidase E
MKLYLSSYRVPVPEALFGLLKKPPTDCTMAIIPNAKDYKLPQERAQSLDELIYDLAKFGFKTDVIDLREYDEPEQLRQKLQSYDVLWAAGGNTFILRSEFKRTGLDSLLGQLLQSGLVYCGESAGAIVAGASLDGAEIGDDPDVADEVIAEGLGFVPNIIVPHADSTGYVEYLNHMKQQYPDDPRVLYLNDNQALVVDGDQEKIVSATG